MIFGAAMMRRCSLGTLALVILSGASVQSAPEIAPNGFLVKFDVSINAPAPQVYDALVGQIGSWWNPEHTYSHDAKNLSIDARPGGCFCEKLPNGGGLEHLRVVYVAPPQVVRFSGALGPLQASGVAGSMTWKLTGGPDNTRLELSYSVGGFIPGGFDKMAPAVEAMLREQLDRLKLFIETGKPTTSH
ncbi:MAG TPA: SRPBCC domain-containing protein [Candidatus Udaeobacter sp.]|nr:SRPBCC domain-containing protein [Candidatus Udaeobacter sp.]